MKFLLADLDVGLTVLDVAAATTSEEIAHRDRENARKAYDTVVRLAKNLKPTQEEKSATEDKLTLLKARLEEVGYGVWVP